ncbi:MAG: FtsX-like permease family protein [Candidatus Sumerlaeia bacterium]|nr:FtsX-like permease family protein [Candidatus Sumerlaeia bacterium]
MAKKIESVQLPFSVALQIVTQGIRVRLGRSLVTLFGVLLGIMFFSSVLTSHLIKVGVADEDRTRAEANRMANILEAELGYSMDGRVGVIVSGELDASEQRLPRLLTRRGIQTFAFDDPAPSGVGRDGERVDILLIMGSESMNHDISGLPQVPIAVTRSSSEDTPRADVPMLVSLTRELSPGELERREAEERTARYRLTWIVAIALVVTLMGITNAMLMSVTERFREIGTMKCLGATRRLVRRIFLLESLIIGGGGGIGGALLGALFSIIFHGFLYGFPQVMFSINLPVLMGFILLSAVSGVVLTVVAAVYPAGIASSMLPSDALRSNV